MKLNTLRSYISSFITLAKDLIIINLTPVLSKAIFNDPLTTILTRELRHTLL